jgi:hypothetical protein
LRTLLLVCKPCGNNPALLTSVCINNNKYPATNAAYGPHSNLAVIAPVILRRYDVAKENRGSDIKAKASLADVPFMLRLMPAKLRPPHLYAFSA